MLRTPTLILVSGKPCNRAANQERIIPRYSHVLGKCSASLCAHQPQDATPYSVNRPSWKLPSIEAKWRISRLRCKIGSVRYEQGRRGIQLGQWKSFQPSISSNQYSTRPTTILTSLICESIIHRYPQGFENRNFAIITHFFFIFPRSTWWAISCRVLFIIRIRMLSKSDSVHSPPKVFIRLSSSRKMFTHPDWRGAGPTLGSTLGEYFSLSGSLVGLMGSTSSRLEVIVCSSFQDILYRCWRFVMSVEAFLPVC